MVELFGHPDEWHLSELFPQPVFPQPGYRCDGSRIHFGLNWKFTVIVCGASTSIMHRTIQQFNMVEYNCLVTWWMAFDWDCSPNSNFSSRVIGSMGRISIWLSQKFMGYMWGTSASVIHRTIQQFLWFIFRLYILPIGQPSITAGISIGYNLYRLIKCCNRR